MAKKKQKNRNHSAPSVHKAKESYSDHLNVDVLERLKMAKKELQEAEKVKEEEREAQLQFERVQREKNKTFEELLDEYGTKGDKY
ncbi:MAG: YqkE family protein [Paenisporosarcina sp.]|nr:YqkE family protein [Paenisporosarcina sp.]